MGELGDIKDWLKVEAQRSTDDIDTKSPTNFWALSPFPSMKKLVIKLATLSINSAGCERSFSYVKAEEDGKVLQDRLQAAVMMRYNHRDTVTGGRLDPKKRYAKKEKEK